MEILLLLQFFIIGLLIWYIKKRNDQETLMITQKVESSLDLKRTMAMGLASRFNYPRTKGENNEVVFEKATNIFLRQTPFEFEDFASEIIKEKYGGDILTTPRTGDFGVDFEHDREEGLYLGQVKVYKNDVDFTPIALIHSNMVKRGAKGGYIITTSDFSSAAKEYANGLNIELIDGVKLVNFWLETMESKVYEPRGDFA